MLTIQMELNTAATDKVQLNTNEDGTFTLAVTKQGQSAVDLIVTYAELNKLSREISQIALAYNYDKG